MVKKVFIILLAFTIIVFAADLVRVAPVTNKILEVTFDEGHLDYFGMGGNRYDDIKVYYFPLDIDAAMESANYSIVSGDDGNYASPQHPVHIGRKAKGEDFNNLYDGGEPKALLDHRIYIELPEALERGKEYTLVLNDFASNTNEYTFVFNEFDLRSETVHVNQIGFVPSAQKYAYLSHFMGNFNTEIHPDGGLELDEFEGNNFHVVRVADNEIVYTGTINKRTEKTNVDFTNEDFENPNVTRADVWECKFTQVQTPGEYKIVVEDIGCSYPFEIKDDVYREAFYWASKGLFAQRQGIIQNLGYYKPGLEYPRGHRTEDGSVMRYFPDQSGHHDMEDTTLALGRIDGIWGWYHDAGDWDGYSHHYRVPFTLLLTYDLKPQNFGDGDLNNIYKITPEDPWIDEGANGIPDILDEAAWLIKFYKRAKDSLIAKGYSDGAVPGYVGVDAGAGDGIPSWTDRRDLTLKGGKSVQMTFIYAAGAAWLSECMEICGADSLGGLSRDEWLTEAVNAYQWAKDHGNSNDAQMMAAATLYRATDSLDYQSDFETTKNASSSWYNTGNWHNIPDWHFAAWNYLKISADDHTGLNTTLQEDCLADIRAKADIEVVGPAADRGYRWGLEKRNNWMLGTFSTPHISAAAITSELTGVEYYKTACHTTCDYHLGGNEMNLVWLCMIGDNYEHSPFHIDSWSLFNYNSAVYRDPIMPGIVPYGGHHTGDWQNGADYNWVGDEDFSRSTTFPSIENFPDAEARFQNRHSIAGSEYTVHQTQCQAILAYGYLCDEFSEPYTPNRPPTVSLVLDEELTVPMDSQLELSVNASDDTRRVEYYYKAQFIGESRNAENNFKFDWDLSKYKLNKGRYWIEAKAFDDRGMVSEPTPEGKVRVKVTPAVSIDKDTGEFYNFKLDGNYPNPFNPTTTIEYSIPEITTVEISVFDIAGNHLETLKNEEQAPGNHRVSWYAGDYSSGVYLYNIKAANRAAVKKCVLLK